MAKSKTCKTCDGSGKVPCDNCEGTGYTVDSCDLGYDHEEECNECENGKVECEDCEGSGTKFD